MRKWGIMRSGHSNVPRLTTGDLFAGAGGLSVGFHNAGFTPLFFNEIDDLAEVIDPETLEANRDVFNRWLKRGDGIAVYENKAMDSIHYGHRVFLSFGSEAALRTPRNACISPRTPAERWIGSWFGKQLIVYAIDLLAKRFNG